MTLGRLWAGIMVLGWLRSGMMVLSWLRGAMMILGRLRAGMMILGWLRSGIAVASASAIPRATAINRLDARGDELSVVLPQRVHLHALPQIDTADQLSVGGHADCRSVDVPRRSIHRLNASRKFHFNRLGGGRGRRGVGGTRLGRRAWCLGPARRRGGGGWCQCRLRSFCADFRFGYGSAFGLRRFIRFAE